MRNGAGSICRHDGCIGRARKACNLLELAAVEQAVDEAGAQHRIGQQGVGDTMHRDLDGKYRRIESLVQDELASRAEP